MSEPEGLVRRARSRVRLSRYFCHFTFTNLSTILLHIMFEIHWPIVSVLSTVSRNTRLNIKLDNVKTQSKLL